MYGLLGADLVKEKSRFERSRKAISRENIEFVSISIDNVKDHDKWKEFVDKEQLGGIQLFANNAWESQFVKDYAIEGIPRFILVDTEGNIVSADAPRPSDKRLVELLTEIGL